MRQQVVIRGVIKSPEGKILLGQRAESKNFPGFWEFPGGKLEPGENFEDAISREVLEETGLLVLKASVCGIENDVSEEYQTQYLVVYFSLEVADLSELRLREPEKTLQWKWFFENNFPPMMSKGYTKLSEAD